MQVKIFTPSCANSGCHTAGSSYAEQSGLVLDANVSYNDLVGVSSKEPHALADGILRVLPGSPDSSLLYLKVHGFPFGKAYGSLMPLGMKALSAGKMEFIRRWIAEGAKKTGDDIDPSLLEDTVSTGGEFTPLDPPAPGTGFQLTTGKFDVYPNFEREIFIYRKDPLTADAYINRIQYKLRPNSHHLALYTFAQGSSLPAYDVLRDLRFPNGAENFTVESQMQDHLFLGGSMVAEEDYHFPDGVALYLKKGTGIDFNVHFINRTSDTLPGEGYANLYTTDPSNVKHLAFPFFDVNQMITLPPHQTTVITMTTTNPNPQPLYVFMLTSHNHEWGEKYQIKMFGGPRNGEIVYESTVWDDPLVKSFDPPIILNPGEGLTSVTTYNNTTDHEIDFGLTSKNEMQVLYGYGYY
jgi:hypothetical protein